jgi:arabinofuranosyltransferase
VSGPDARVRTLALALLAVLPGALLAAWQAAANWPFFSDDSFISLRFAERLLEGKGLTWTDGERVEGYSNLLWVLATAGLGALGLDLVTAARALGAVCTLLAQWCLVRALPPRDLAGALRAAAGPLLVAAGAPMMTWTLGGLEGPMVLLWLAWGGARLVRAFADADGAPATRALRSASLPFALLCVTRPDGPLWTAAIAAVLGAAALRAGVAAALRRALAFAALPIALALAQLLFRLDYYGDLVPNTAHVKVDLGNAMLQTGLEHTGRSLFVLLGNLVPAVLGAAVALREPQRRTPVLALALACIAWTVYVTSVGGDHFPGYRLWHGMLAPLALLAVLGIDALPRRWPAQLAGALTVLGGVAAALLQARHDDLGTYARGETWEQDGKVLGEALQRAFARAQPRLAVDAAGALPFWSRLPALDMLGLCDRTIATSPPPPFLAAVLAAIGKTSVPGHMRGNGRYVMDCAPDLVLFANPPGMPLAVFVSALEFEDDPRWLDGYRCAVLELAGARPLQAPLWFRIDGRAGVRRVNGPRGDERVEVPALLLGAYRQPRPFRTTYAQPAPGTPERTAWQADVDAAVHWFTGERFVAAVPAADGGLELELRADKPAALDLTLAAGRWRIEPDRQVALDFALRGDAATATADGAFTIAGAGSQRVSLVATPRRGARLPLRLRTVTLVRMS